MIAAAGWALLWSVNLLVLAYFVVLNGTYLVTSLLAVRSLRRYAARVKCVDVKGVIESGGAPPVTVIAPAYDEEATCVESVRSLLTLNYPDHRIIVVNDGSKDATRQRLIDAFEMTPTPQMPTAELHTRPVRAMYRSRWHPNLWLLDKENGGKADALNAGLRYCETPLFCVIDMDTLVEPDALVRVVWPFLEDGRTVAAGGVIRIANGCTVEDGVVRQVRLPRSLLARFQVLEYLRAFLSSRMGWEAHGGLLIISGAFGVFRRSTTVEAGGFWTRTVGEDMELVVRLHRHCREEGRPYRIRSVPEAVAWTEVPETLGGLARQRDRWQRGLTESLLRHRVMLLKRRYGRVGMVAYPWFFLLEMLGPVIEVVGYVAFAATVLLGWASPAYVAVFLMVAVAFSMALSVVAVGLGELTYRRYPRTRDLLHLFWLAVLENVGYRQLNTYWRVRGMASHLRGRREWGERARKGFQPSGASSATLAALALAVAAGAAEAQEVQGQGPAHTEGRSQVQGPAPAREQPDLPGAGLLRALGQPREAAPFAAGLTHQRIGFRSDEPGWRRPWTESRLHLSRRFERGSIALIGGATGRFGRTDASAAADVYAELWEGAYGNLRVRRAPGAEISARTDASVELFQAFGAHFEAAAGMRTMRFADDRVRVASAALGRYQGAWYLRGQIHLTPKEGERAVSFVGQARRDLGGPDDFVELGAGVGEEILTIGDGPAVELRRTRLLRGRAVRSLHPRVSAEGQLLLTRYEGLPSGIGISLGARTRW